MSSSRPFGTHTLLGNWQEERAAAEASAKAEATGKSATAERTLVGRPEDESDRDRWTTTSAASFQPHDVERRRQPRPPVEDASTVMLGHGARQEDWSTRDQATIAGLTYTQGVRPQEAVDPKFVPPPPPERQQQQQPQHPDVPAGKPTGVQHESTVRPTTLTRTLDDPMNAMGLRR